jgi:hypothetical protein
VFLLKALANSKKGLGGKDEKGFLEYFAECSLNF